MEKYKTIDGYRGYWIGCEYNAEGDTIAFVATDGETGAEIAHPDLDQLFRIIDKIKGEWHVPKKEQT